MRPGQIWLDLSGPQLKIWMNQRLESPEERGHSFHRLGFFREIPLYHLPTSSAVPLGWISFHWTALQGKLDLEDDFWIALEAQRFGIFSHGREDAPFAPPLGIEFPLASDIVFFGGTFDPWHQGHGACIERAPTNVPLLICPDRNPHKPLTRGDAIPRYLKLLEEIPPRPNRYLYPGHLVSDQHNPTVKWVLQVKRNRPDLRVRLLMGHDSFAALPTWTRTSELLKLLSGIYVVSRLEKDEERAEGEAWAKAQNPQLAIEFLGHHAHESVSSTKLRR